MNFEEFYNCYSLDNNMTYSIDMIRLKTYITYSQFSNLEFLFNVSWSNFVKKTYTSARLKDFFYNYIIQLEDGQSFWFGFLHNNERRVDDRIFQSREGTTINIESKYNFTIEFNPNKIKRNKVLDYLLCMSSEWFLRGYDLAIDLNINILDLICDMSGRSLEKIENRGFDNKTIYIGKGDGRVKVYNKKKESDLNILHDLTRIEISREIEDFNISRIAFFDYDGNFPEIYTMNYMYSFSDYKDKTTLALLYAVQNGFPIRDLTRSYKQKVKTMLEGGNKIKFNKKVVTLLIRQTIFFYFLKSGKVLFL